MVRSKAMNVFGVITIALLSVVNILHLLWTVWLTYEQINMGWGKGTDIGMAALWPWLVELLCLPVLIVAIVFLCISVVRRPLKRILITNVVLLLAAVTQYVVTNLFIWF